VSLGGSGRWGPVAGLAGAKPDNNSAYQQYGN
jgi:hypothetical protein